MISAIIVTCCFIGSIILILTNKLNRAITVLAGSIITYFTLTFIEHKPYSIFLEFLFGTSADGYVNLRALVLIIGMLFIVQISHSAGVFQFIGFKLIQLSRGKPFNLLLVFCALSLLISAVLNNILAVIILVPLTIVASLILGIDPSPYIIAEAVMVNVGGIIFSISSIPNILITTYAEISFIDFFLNVGLLAFILFIVTMIFFHFYHRRKLIIPKERFTEVLQEFNVWNYVPNRQLFYKSIMVLIGVMVCFIAIPPNILSADIIALTGGISLVILSKLNGKDVLKKIDFELLFYLMGIFIITGAMESLGVIDIVGTGLVSVTGNNPFASVLLILWISAFMSSSIDNIPITKVLIPVVDGLSTGFTPLHVKTSYYSLAFGANLGDNLTPLGDNVLVMNIAEENERPISVTQFFRLGFIASIIQLCVITIYLILLFDVTIGLIIFSLIGLALFLIIFIRYLKENVKKQDELIFIKLLNKVKNQNYRIDKRRLLYKPCIVMKRMIQKLFGIGRE